MATMRSAPSLLLKLLQRSTAFQVKFFVVLGRVPASSGWKILARSKSVGSYFRQLYILDAAAHTFTTSGFSLLCRLASDISEFLEQPEFQLIFSERDGWYNGDGRWQGTSSLISLFQAARSQLLLLSLHHLHHRDFWGVSSPLMAGRSGSVSPNLTLAKPHTWSAHFAQSTLFSCILCFRARFSNYDSTLQSPANSESNMSIAASLRN